ncbi:hypothetical protein [Swingsia samuiensis]|uniref:DUF1795 domain-containing protein n=1 Tax=Swingsia samuiensis TaxID=1293412 RepID=A0A4Y6UNX8_9PROT|nr:hypothetical protein [Swingsia samuiensis]QDH18096.1 hypothetical protein E3D00_10370 [Swingsia samuiensis]
MTYHLPGFSFDPPENTQDNSIIALTLSPPNTTPFNVHFIHSPIPLETTLEEFIIKDLTIRKEHDDYILKWKKPYQQTNLSGFILAGFIEETDERRLYILSGNKVLILTAHTQGIFSSEQLHTLNQLVQSLRVNTQNEI